MQQAANIQALFQQARTAYTARRLDDALSLSNRLLSLAGEREETLNLKALTLLALDRPLEAKAVIDRALKANPRSAGMHLNAARIELVLADRRAARRHAREAGRLQPNDPPTLYQASILCRQGGDYALAMRLVDRCQARAPRLPEARHLKGSMLLDQGNTEAAAAEFEAALALQPGHARSLADLAQIPGRTETHPEFTAHLEQVAHRGRDPWDRSTALFAWADLLHKQGDTETAAGRYREANDIGATVRPFDMDAWERKQERTLERYRDLSPLGAPGEGAGANLVFLVGMPRSGTSLAEQVIGAHPDALPCGELTAMHAIELYRPEDQDDNAARRRYLDALPPEHVGKALVTDKLPMNFERVGMIHRLFPGARFVHCRRHPLDTVLSCYQQDFQAGVQWAFDLDRIARAYLAQQRLMAHWTRCLPEHIHALDYESLVTDLPAAVDTLCSFLGVAPVEAMQAPHRSAGTVQTASRLQVREAVYTSSVEKWRAYDALLAPAIERLQAGGALDGAGAP